MSADGQKHDIGGFIFGAEAAGPEPLDLAALRVMDLKGGGRDYAYRFARITPGMWLEYFSALRLPAGRLRNSRIIRRLCARADRALVRACLAGTAEIPTTEGEWSEFAEDHVRAAASFLLSTSVHAVVRSGDGVAVDLLAIWTASNGRTAGFGGFAHRFILPNAEQEHRYHVADVQGRRVLACLANLYDELIQGVDNYAVAGQPLDPAASLDQVRREMDLCHKVVAVRPLFMRAGQSVCPRGCFVRAVNPYGMVNGRTVRFCGFDGEPLTNRRWK